MHEITDNTGIKLDYVASDMLGMSGGAILRAVVEGTNDRTSSPTWRSAWDCGERGG